MWRHLKLEHQGHGSYAFLVRFPSLNGISRMRVSLPALPVDTASTRAATALRPRQPSPLWQHWLATGGYIRTVGFPLPLGAVRGALG